MQVQPTTMPVAEFQDFEQAIRAAGRDPCAFKAQLFIATLLDAGTIWRRVHVVTPGAAAQYDASGATRWTENFARHLARGFFG